MSTSAITSQAPDWVRSSFETIQTNVYKPQNWLYLVPTVGAIALGVLFAPNFAIGLAAGAGIFVFSSVVSIVLSATGLCEKDENSEYEKTILENPWFGTLFAPIAEEGIFRGLLQPLATRCILWAIPAAGVALLGPGISVAVTVSIVATAALFGLVHYFNDHKNSHIQAAMATVSGIAFGLIAAQFGLPAAIAAHMLNNTIAITLMKLAKSGSQGIADPISQTATLLPNQPANRFLGIKV